MSQKAQLTDIPKFKLTVLVGNEKGREFFVTSSSIKIGRGTENDIVIKNDSRCSREHALIEQTSNGFTIRNISGKNTLLVNDEIVEDFFLEDGSQIILGETKLRFNFMVPQSDLAGTPVKVKDTKNALKKQNFSPVPKDSANVSQSPYGIAPQTLSTHSSQKGSGKRKTQNKKKGGGRLRFYTIIFVIGFGLFWFFSSGSKKKKTLEFRTSEQIALDIEKSRKSQENLLEKRKKTGKVSIQYKKAQSYYIKGFRDYGHGQYSRAMESFRAALSLYPSHVLSRKYLQLSKRKYDETVQFNMIQGRRYLSKNNYRLCMSSFKNVLVMLGNNKSPLFKEAKQLFNECKTLLEGRY